MRRSELQNDQNRFRGLSARVGVTNADTHRRKSATDNHPTTKKAALNRRLFARYVRCANYSSPSGSFIRSSFETFFSLMSAFSRMKSTTRSSKSGALIWATALGFCW